MIELVIFSVLMLSLQAVVIPLYDYLILDVLLARFYSYIPSMDLDTLIEMFQQEMKK